jgi:chemotaxis protein MotB
MNLNGSIVDMNDQDIDVKVEKGVVFIDISDKMLFNTGEYKLTSKARNVLAKVAAVMKGQPNIEFLVEGHTDNVPIRGGNLRDNWDLSVLRATAVVRSLQKDFGIEPARMTAGGRSEYKPKAPNDTAEGRAQNRRTRIVVLPELDQFFQLLEPNKQAGKPGE